MKLTLVTVYENLNEEWLVWYLNRLKSSKIPDLIETAKNLEKGEPYSFTTLDGKVIATTRYELENP